VDDNNVVERRSVKLGIQVDDRRVVEEGLSDQDWVLVNGMLRAIPGNTVNPVRKPLTGAKSNTDVSPAPTELGKPTP
jgi:hypothetical protein